MVGDINCRIGIFGDNAAAKKDANTHDYGPLEGSHFWTFY
jgi:hypothetical protein